MFAHGVVADLAERDPLGERWTPVTAQCAVPSLVRDSNSGARGDDYSDISAVFGTDGIGGP